ncbi:MAG: MFS transporter [Chloroflexota bacterium]|nr:MFS transporter [Chloroflexota bacterium]MDE2941457.1 MFS transporter [Chloroflexota bacterium]MDE3268542.1 MFS transporter [Chloroflexota bacterium]
MQDSDRTLTRRDTAVRRMPRTLMAFEVTAFRWLWGSFLFGSMSMSVRMLAQGWLVLEITDSPFWVGAIAGIQGLGLVGFGAFGGTIVERYDKRFVLGVVYFFGFVISGLTGFLAITGQIQLWHMAPIALTQGMLMGTQLPASNVLAYQIVGPERLLNAMASRLMAMNISRVIGSLIAGALIHNFGVGSSYLLAASGSAVGLAFLLVIRGDFRAAPQREPFWQSTGQGLRYAWRNSAIRRLLFLSLLMEAFGFSHLVMMPVMARDVLNVGATGLGYLSAASGLGSMLSTLGVASLGDFRRKGPLLAFTTLGAGVSIVLFAYSPVFALSLLMAGLAGGSLMAYDVTMGTMLQLHCDDDMRGRVLGIYGLTFGFTSVGGSLAGAVATVINPPFAVAMGGVFITLYIGATFRSALRLDRSARRKQWRRT